MGKYNFNDIVNRRNAYSYKWNTRENDIPMFVADMDYHVFPLIKEEIQKRSEIDSYGYIYTPKEYFEAYQGWLDRHHHVKVDTSWMLYSTGVVAALCSIMRHVIPEHSGIIMFTPIYHTFHRVIKGYDHQVVSCELLKEDNNYVIDYEKLESLLKDDNNKVFLLCNPHNPIGRIWTKEELKRLLDLCNKYHKLFISDEIHIDIVDPGYECTSILSLDNNVITLLSASKAFNLAGLKSACVIVKDEEFRNKIKDGMMIDNVGSPNYFAPVATITAYKYGDDWLDELNEYLSINKEYVKNFIEKEIPHVKYIHGHGTYLLWLDISYYDKDSERFSKRLKEEAGIIVNEGKIFGDGGEGHIRVNIASSLDKVKEACNRLKLFFHKY